MPWAEAKAIRYGSHLRSDIVLIIVTPSPRPYSVEIVSQPPERIPKIPCRNEDTRYSYI